MSRTSVVYGTIGTKSVDITVMVWFVNREFEMSINRPIDDADQVLGPRREGGFIAGAAAVVFIHPINKAVVMRGGPVTCA